MKLRDVCRKADLAIRLGAIEYAGDLCEHILLTFPSDLRARTLLGQAYLEQSKLAEACQQFDLVLELDPENVAALTADGVAHSAAGQLNAAVRAFERAYELNPGNTQVRDSLTRLYAERDGNATVLSPAPPVAMIRWQLGHGDLDDALAAASEFLMTRPGDVCVLLSQAEALWRAGRRDDAEQACRQLLARHPRCLKARLILGQILSADRTREAEGVEALHSALAEDPGGVVVGPLFRGTTFAPPILADEVLVSVPDHLLAGPADIDAALEAMPVASGEDADAEWRPPEMVRDPTADGRSDAASGNGSGATQEGAANEDLGAVAAARTEAECLLAISCRGPLVARYGFEGFQRLERRLQTVARELAFLGTRFVIAFVDDPGSMSQHELSPVWSTDPQAIKQAIDELDRTVAKDDRGVDGILIIGGDDVVPFFHLPNPADDDDSAVLSDNPYGATPGGSSYAPDIAIGRLPDGSGGNLSLLLRQIDTLLDLRRKPPVADNGPRIVQAGLAALGAIRLGGSSSLAFGCAAAPWESVSGQVFSPLAPASLLRLSPPTTAGDFKAQWIDGRRFLYFNLHGALDSAAWYGERTGSNPDDASALPVALTTDQLSEVDLGAPVIFSEASYGANVLSKSATNSLALRFLNEGATAFVGSTAASYGAVEPPLAGADLLGRLFWSNLRSGDRVGVALQRAKSQYTRELIENQGYLDGDDQKTLLEFVLYGDPLMPVFQEAESIDDESDADSSVPLALICNQAMASSGPRSVAPKLLRAAIEHLVDLCPEAAGAAVRVHRRAECTGGCDQPGHPTDRPESSPEAHRIIAVTVRKELPTTDGPTIVKVARVTLDESGDLLKGMVSR